MAEFRLPVSGLDVVFRQATGAEDVLLVEETVLDIRLALAMLDALGRLPDGHPVPWESLSITDLDAALLAIRRSFVGNQVRSTVRCTATARSQALAGGEQDPADENTGACHARVDIAFNIDDYLAYHAPAPPRGVSQAEEPGWFRLGGTAVTYRLATCADQIAVAGRLDAERELVRRCIRPASLSGPLRRKTEAAMSRLAPNLFDYIEGICPECQSTIRISFDPQRYVLGEMRERAKFVFEEVHLIAARYQWSEREILALPRTRRARYAELVYEAREVG